MESPKCGECGSDMVLRETKKYTNPDGSPKTFYGCSTYPTCKGTHSAHQANGKPMGIPADAETKKWRGYAHEEFDVMWKLMGYTGPEAYAVLADIMDKRPEEAHIAMFTKEECKKLLKLLEVEGKYEDK